MTELREVGRLIGPIEQIEITGGEPTLHSGFAELATNLPEYFECNDVMLVSNGFLFGRDPSKLPLLLNFKRVWITHYTERFVENNPKSGIPNTATVELIKAYLEEHKHPHFQLISMNDHIPFSEPPYGGQPCGHYYSHLVSYYEGQLYGCCVAWSLPMRGQGIALTSNWRENLNNIELPCENCFLSTAGSEKPRFVKSV